MHHKRPNIDPRSWLGLKFHQSTCQYFESKAQGCKVSHTISQRGNKNPIGRVLDAWALWWCRKKVVPKALPNYPLSTENGSNRVTGLFRTRFRSLWIRNAVLGGSATKYRYIHSSGTRFCREWDLDENGGGKLHHLLPVELKFSNSSVHVYVIDGPYFRNNKYKIALIRFRRRVDVNNVPRSHYLRKPLGNPRQPSQLYLIVGVESIFISFFRSKRDLPE